MKIQKFSHYKDYKLSKSMSLKPNPKFSLTDMKD